MSKSKEEILEMGFFNKWRVFSNFHLKTIHMLGFDFPSNENAYMAHKNPLRAGEFADIDPMAARKLGQKVELRLDWDHVKLDIMLDINRMKYASGYENYMLVGTGQKTLVEYNWWHDNYWGDCLCPRCEEVDGKNVLGNILMQIRSEL